MHTNFMLEVRLFALPTFKTEQGTFQAHNHFQNFPKLESAALGFDTLPFQQPYQPPTIQFRFLQTV